MTHTATALATSLLCLLPAPATAAGTWVNPYTGSTWNNPVSSQLETMIRGRLLRESMEREVGNRRGPAPAASATETPERVTYRPAASHAAHEFAASLFEDPRERDELASSLEGSLASYRREAERAGRKNDVAFALSFFIAGNYAVYAQRDVSDEAIAAVARQLDGALAAMPGLRQASDAQRQGFAERLVCSTAFVLAGYQQGTAQKNEQQKQAFRALAAALLRQTVGVEAERVSVTDTGMVVKGSSAR